MSQRNVSIAILAGTDARSLRSLDDELLTFQQEWNGFFMPRFQRLEFLQPDEFKLTPSP